MSLTRWCMAELAWLWHAMFDGTSLCVCSRSQEMKRRRTPAS